jgi:threonine dehydratase
MSRSDMPPDVVLIPGGVGGILHAGVAHYARVGAPRVVGVEPSSADCLTASLESPDGRPGAGDGRRRHDDGLPQLRRSVTVVVAGDQAGCGRDDRDR